MFDIIIYCISYVLMSWNSVVLFFFNSNFRPTSTMSTYKIIHIWYVPLSVTKLGEMPQTTWKYLKGKEKYNGKINKLYNYDGCDDFALHGHWSALDISAICYA